MSTFKGLLDEYPFIALDYFKSKTLDASVSAYFLSHCHSDHMAGMSSIEFTQKLESNSRIKLYTSEVTKLLLVNDEQYKHLELHLEVLPLEQPTIVTLQSSLSAKETEIVVTLLPAGHCPGSVMFLIEGSEGTVLYTGDFRFSVGDVQKIHWLHQANEEPKEIKGLYIDTTFCRMEASYIPSRSLSLDTVISLINPWMAKGEDYFVRLICSAQYGYEYLFIGLAHKFNMKVHVNESKLKKYCGISEIEEAITSNAQKTRIHACQWRTGDSQKSPNSELPCQKSIGNKKGHVLSIKLSAMWYAQYVSIQETCLKCGPDFYRVCFSTHSSLSELQDVVRHLKPQKIHPNVVPKDKTPDQVVKWLLPNKANGFLLNSTVGIPSKTPMDNGDASLEGSPSIDDCEESGICSQQTDVTSSHGSQNWHENDSELDLSGDEMQQGSVQENSSPVPDSGIGKEGPKWHYEFSPVKKASDFITSSAETVQPIDDSTKAGNADSTDEQIPEPTNQMAVVSNKQLESISMPKSGNECLSTVENEKPQDATVGDSASCTVSSPDKKGSEHSIQDISVGDSTSNFTPAKSRASAPAKDKGSADDGVTSCESNPNGKISATANPSIDLSNDNKLLCDEVEPSNLNDVVTSHVDENPTSGTETVDQIGNASECEVVDGHLEQDQDSVLKTPLKKRPSMLNESGASSSKYVRVSFAEDEHFRTSNLDVHSPSSSDSSCCVTSTDVMFSSTAVRKSDKANVQMMDCETSSTSDDLFSDDSSIVECDGSSDSESRNSGKSSQNTSGIELVDSGGSSPDVLCICDSSSVIINPMTKVQTEGKSGPVEVVNVDDDITSPTDTNTKGSDREVAPRGDCIWTNDSSQARCEESDITPEKIVVNGHCISHVDSHRRNLFANDARECTSTADIEIITIDD